MQIEPTGEVNKAKIFEADSAAGGAMWCKGTNSALQAMHLKFAIPVLFHSRAPSAFRYHYVLDSNLVPLSSVRGEAPTVVVTSWNAKVDGAEHYVFTFQTGGKVEMVSGNAWTGNEQYSITNSQGNG